MRQLLRGVVLGAAVASVLLAATAAYAGTGIGAIFNLGKTNSVNATTTLQGSSPKTLQLNNSGSGAAIGLRVNSGQPPLTTNSQTEVGNLNSALVDGETASDFQQKSDSVRISRIYSVGNSQGFDIGPLLALETACTSSGGSTYLNLSILDNAQGSGDWSISDTLNRGTNPSTVYTFNGGITSGHVGTVTRTIASNQDSVTLVWQDATETISIIYTAEAFPTGCQLFGTAMRTT